VERRAPPVGNAFDKRGGRGAMTKTPSSLQDLRRRIDTKAKAAPSWRFWGLSVQVCQWETLREASRLAKANHGAPERDGVTCEAIEADGGETCLPPLQDALVTRTYRPMRLRHKAMPKANGKGVRVLSMPTLRDRVVQGAFQRMLAPRFAADCPPGSSGYRPQRSAHDAVLRVAEARVQDKTRGIDVDVPASCDHSRPHLLVAQVAQRVKDPEVRHASGKKGVAPGGGRSPLRSHRYLTAVDRRLERAQEVTRRGSSPSLAEARFADALVLWGAASPQHAGLRKAVDKRLREALAALQVAIHEEKSRRVDLAQGEHCRFVGFDVRRVWSRRGVWRAWYPPMRKKRTALVRKLKEIVHRPQSQPLERVSSVMNPMLRGWVPYVAVGDASRGLGLSKDGVAKKVRRHRRRARKRRGGGWKRGSRQWRYQRLGLCNTSRVHRPRLQALPSREAP
jgi:RNA-directed DNA polymerase